MKIRNTKAKVVKRVIGAGEEPVDGIIIDTSTPNLEKIAECYINNKDKYRFVCPSCGVEVFPRRAPRRTSDILKRKVWEYSPKYYFAAPKKHTPRCEYNKSSKRKRRVRRLNLGGTKFNLNYIYNYVDPDEPGANQVCSQQAIETKGQDHHESSAELEINNSPKELTTIEKIYEKITLLSADAVIANGIYKKDYFIDRNYPDKEFQEDLSGDKMIVAKRVSTALLKNIAFEQRKGYVCLINEDADYDSGNPENVLFLLVKCKKPWVYNQFAESVMGSRQRNPHSYIVIMADWKKVKCNDNLHVYKAYINSKQYLFTDR